MLVNLRFEWKGDTYDYRKATPLKQEGVDSVVDESLKDSIDEMGLLSPLHFWRCPISKEVYYVDGNGRYTIFTKNDARLSEVLSEDAYHFPCIFINAADRKEAIKILLEKEKHYNKWKTSSDLLAMCEQAKSNFEKTKIDLLPTLSNYWSEKDDLLDLALGEEGEQLPPQTQEPESEGNNEQDQDKKITAYKKKLSSMLAYQTANSPKRISRTMDVLDWDSLLLGDVLDYGGGNDLHMYSIYDPCTNPDISLLTKKYDTIVCSNVFVHFALQHQWIESLMTIMSLLKKGGIAYIGSFNRHTQEDTLEKDVFFNGKGLDFWQKEMSLLFDVAILSEKDGILAVKHV